MLQNFFRRIFTHPKLQLKTWEWFFIGALFLVAVFVRWYKLPTNLFFGFEQGRDAQIIREIFANHEFKLVGPKTDLAGIFHGAYYYYLLLPAYILSQGNPTVASFWLVILSSLLIPLSYFFGLDFFRSKKAALLTAVLVTFSYEYIIYARWLSNVTPAIPLTLLTFWSLWCYHRRQQVWSFVLAVIAAALAAQFEIVLALLFAWIFVALFLTRIISWPNWKALGVAVIAAAIIFAPHALFNFRNQNIIVTSVIGYITGRGNEHVRTSFNSVASWQIVSNNYLKIFGQAIGLPTLFIGVIGLAFLVIIIQYFRRPKNKINFAQPIFLLVWLSICLPVFLFSDVANLYQLYLGVGLAWIFLFVWAMQILWRWKLDLPVGKVIVLCSGAVLLLSPLTTFQKLHTNQDVFFITIQEGLNYADQYRVLSYIHQDAQEQTYRLVAYTIPYLQPQGWQYLRSYFFPTDQVDDGAKLVYIVIEPQVEQFWQNKWTEELGKSELVGEQQFGRLRVQKRILQ